VSQYAEIDPEVLTEELLDSAELKAFLSVLTAASTITTDAEQVFRDAEVDLIPREWDLLVAASTFGPMRPSELLRRVWMTKSPQTLSSMLDRLETRGYVTRNPHPEDSRGVIVSITPEGERTVTALFPLIARRVIAPFSVHFTDDEAEAITEMLGRLT
jgi:DNA-binding MarR family transcriptional regulator